MDVVSASLATLLCVLVLIDPQEMITGPANNSRDGIEMVTALPGPVQRRRGNRDADEIVRKVSGSGCSGGGGAHGL